MGIMESFINSGNKNNLHTKSTQRTHDIFHNEDLRKENSKLRIYNYVKNQIGVGGTISTENKSIKGRIAKL